jgi:hypothetical protein
MSLPVVAQRFIDAITIGDADAARSCYAPDADIWHNFDGVTQTVDDNIALMNAMTTRIADRRYVIRRRPHFPHRRMSRPGAACAALRLRRFR